MMSTDALRTLCQVNDSLRSALERFGPEQQRSSPIAACDFSSLLAELLRAGECLRDLAAQPPTGALPGLKDVEVLEQQSREYRNNLEKLKRFLPDLHARLLAEKARLQNAQNHVAAAAAWAGANGKTF